MKRVPYMMNISKVQADLIDAFVASNPNQDSFERAELFKFAEEQGFSGSAAYTLMKQMPRVARGVYQMVGSGNVIQMNAPLAAPVALPQVEQTPIAKAVAKVQSTSSEEVYIPSADPTFVKWGYFADVLKIVKSNMFYPMYVIKKTGEVITPAPGFNVIATANTKGQGDEQGRFIAATIIDEAFLERFTITLEQPYPTAATEKRIVTNHMSKFGANDKEFTEKLVQWAQAIRKTFEDGGIDEIISTRRLCHIVQTFSIFSDRMKAIELCVNRFDADTRAAFLDLYSKIDADVTTEEPIGEEIQNTGDNAKYFA